MERLTNIGSNGEIWITDNDETRRFGRKESAYKKLAQYEDLEEQGLLLRLPVKAGDTVYRYVEEKGCVLEYTVWNISMSAYESGGIDIVIEGCAESEDEVEDEFSLSLIDFKNEFFNTKAEAEQKLKEMEGRHGIAE